MMTQHWDLVVVGAGTAGLPAAIVAARRGTRTLLIDAADTIGGTMHLSSGSLAGGGSAAQLAKGIEDSAERHYRDCVAIGSGTAQDDVLALWTRNAPDTIDWLYAEGVPFGEQMPTFSAAHEAYDAPRTFTPPQGARDILAVFAAAIAPLVEQGTLTLQLSTRMTGLVQDEDGAVTGLRATGPDGVEETVRADAVVLATGGYAHNAKLWKRLHPDTPHRVYAWPQSRGDGHLAAEAIGARIAHQENFLPTYGATRDLEDPDVHWIHTMVAPAFRPPWEISVNLEGRRFMREDLPSPDGRERALRSQSEQTFWWIWDARVAREAPPLFRWDEDKIARAFAQSPDFQTAETLEDLARACSLDAEVLAQTVVDYNAAVASGNDTFGRAHMPVPLGEGPFYAVRHMSTSVVTWGGLRVDGELRVLDAAGEPIPNLYAAGEVLGMGVFGSVFLGGSTMSSSLTFGKLLGERLSKRPASAAPLAAAQAS